MRGPLCVNVLPEHRVSGSIHMVARVRASPLFMAEQHAVAWTQRWTGESVHPSQLRTELPWVSCPRVHVLFSVLLGMSLECTCWGLRTLCYASWGPARPLPVAVTHLHPWCLGSFDPELL